MNRIFLLTVSSAFLIVILWSCKPTPTRTGIIEMVKINGKEIPKINLDQVDDSATTIKLSDLFEDFRIIPLETGKECLIENTKIGFTDYSILVSTQSGSDKCRVLEFDMTGKYIREFGRWGKGPGEHTGYTTNELSYYPDNKQVLISFSQQNGNQLFSEDGRFLSHIINPIPYSNGIKKFNDTIWMTPGYLSGNPEDRRDSIRLGMFTANGIEIKAWPRIFFPPANKSGYSPQGWGSPLYKYQNQWQIYSPGDDTLYRIGLDRLDPLAVFNPGPKGEPYNQKIDPSLLNGTYSIKLVDETERNWYLVKSETVTTNLKEFSPDRWLGSFYTSEFLLVIDKKTGVARNLRFEDDFLGIMLESKSVRRIQWSDTGQPFMPFMALELKESIKVALKKENLDPKIRIRLEQLDKQITVDSNPVIVLMKTKED